MLPKSKWRQFGHEGNNKKGLIVHNTNNQQMSAEELEKWLKNDCRTSQGCHFIVDHKEVRKVMPLSWSVYNVGNALAFGNTDCIAVEICSNPSEKLYLLGQSKAIDLIIMLMGKFGLTSHDIYFHRDFQQNINCPAQILNIYGSKDKFLQEIERRINGD